jgi:hypothetical protein
MIELPDNMWSQKFKNGMNTKSMVGVMPTWNKRSNPRRLTGIAAMRLVAYAKRPAMPGSR